MSPYSKAIAALVVSVLVAALTAWQAAVADGWTAADVATVVLAALTPVAVYLAPRNADPEE